MRARPQRLLRFLGAERGLGGREGIGDTGGVLATGLGHVRTTATATVDQTRDLLDHVTGVETGLDGVIGAGSEQGLNEKQMRGKIDMIAASLFLQTWLDRKNEEVSHA